MRTLLGLVPDVDTALSVAGGSYGCCVADLAPTAADDHATADSASGDKGVV